MEPGPKQKSCNNRDQNESEVLKSCEATVMTNDFELNILVNKGTSEISVKWDVNVVVFSCYFSGAPRARFARAWAEPHS